MAIRARLAAPPPPEAEPLPALAPKWTTLPAHILWQGDRRMEAENYLSTGYGLRLAIEERPAGWKQFSQIARVWQPSRLKGIQLGPEFGTPFFSATQVFDHRPVPRKWLALGRTDSAQDRFVDPGTILVTCSGAVGRSLLAYEAHVGALISHDLLRVEANESEQWGWIYAYLRSPQARAMMSGAQYGHIIKHLETSHLDALPIPILRHGLAADFHKRTQTILDCRSRVHRLTLEAEERFAALIGSIKEARKEDGFEVRASNLFSGRRRLEASFHAPMPAAILRRFKALKTSVVPLYQLTEKVWWMTRFRRFYGEDGIPYLSADELFTINPPDAKRILIEPSDGHESYFVKRGWIVMACSGQVYGLNGAACLMTEDHEGVFFSHDLIRIIPQENVIRTGYLLTALTHPTLGRPLLIRAAYGTSIPHLDPGDVSNFPVVRLPKPEETAIADLAEQAASERARADVLDRTLADDAGRLLERFLAGDMEPFVASIHLKDRL